MKILLFTILFLPTIATAQLSGYVSSSYGYNANPLYNYEQRSDQVSQSYVELHHTSDFDNSSLDLGYTGGLVLFNRFSERNYYEHSLAGKWAAAVREPDDENAQEADSLGGYLAAELKFTARHDKSAFNVYDNESGGLSVSYRTMVSDPLFVRLTNKAEYRSYERITELSNFTDVVAVSLGSGGHDRMHFEILANVGIKHYTRSLSDTSTYETITPTGSDSGSGTGTGHGHGKGLGSGNSGGSGSSGSAPGFLKKEHLYVTTESSSTWQVAVGGIVEKQWDKSSLLAGFVYRYNPSAATRYVAQYVNTTTLSEDIYNDHFAYEGPEASFRFTQTFPLRITSALQFQWASRTYSGPALSLDGVQTADKRKDTQLGIEVTLSKAFTIFDGVDLEVNLSGLATRNQSNDAYNDYSGSSVAAGVALGF